MSDQPKENPVQPLGHLGRNEPCPCGSRKKYKRCCGVHAMPKLYEAKPLQNPASGNSVPNHPMPNHPMMDPSILNQFDPQMLAQMTQAFQRLPQGQLQKMQALMQKAMSGKDITQEAQEFERSLPSDFQTMMQSFAHASDGLSAASPPSPTPSAPVASPEVPPMTVEEARALIQQAAAQGQISQEEANQLLQHPKTAQPESTPESPSKFGKLWQSISGRDQA